MKNLKMYFFCPLIALMLFGFSSCTTKAVKADEQEIHAMDSVSKDLDQSAKELEDQNKKVEASLEKLDKELTTAE